jgi:hypothetical protein
MPIIAGRASAAYGAGFGAVTTIPYQGPFGAYDALISLTVSSAVSSVTFSGIPNDYQHLQLRNLATQGTGGTSAGSDTFNTARFNGDTGSNYISHAILSDGASTSSVNTGASQTSMWLGVVPTGATSSFGASVLDILDYSSTSKNKVIRGLNGHDRSGIGIVCFQSAMWMNSSTAVNQITIFATSGTFSIGSQFALYGVK